MSSNVHLLPLGSGSPVPPRDERDWVTRHELTNDTGITYRQADYWTRTGLLTAIADGHRGTGHQHRYDHTQVDRATAVRQLLDAGMSLPAIRDHIDEYVTTGQIDLGPITLTRTTNKENQPT